MFPIVFATLLALFAAASASAQTIFTINTTANSTGGGYTATLPYSFVFTSGASFSSNGNDYFVGSQSFWAEYSTGEDQLWTALGGTGLSGAYSRPGSIWNELNVQSTFLSLRAGPDSPNSAFGVSRLDAADLGTVYAAINSGLSFTPSATYVEPFGSSGYFSNYAGSFSVGGSVDLRDTSGNHTYFTITDMSISVTAVPEPSTYAALTGLVALGFVAYRRRQRTVSV